MGGGPGADDGGGSNQGLRADGNGEGECNSTMAHILSMEVLLLRAAERDDATHVLLHVLRDPIELGGDPRNGERVVARVQLL
eukprot:9490002-Pyramimonas_sp.AAC.2